MDLHLDAWYRDQSQPVVAICRAIRLLRRNDHKGFLEVRPIHGPFRAEGSDRRFEGSLTLQNPPLTCPSRWGSVLLAFSIP